MSEARVSAKVPLGLLTRVWGGRGEHLSNRLIASIRHQRHLSGPLNCPRDHPLVFRAKLITFGSGNLKLRGYKMSQELSIFVVDI